jgi:hypothetical protein
MERYNGAIVCMRGHMTLEQVLTIANQLSPIDKFRLVQQVLSEIEPTSVTLPRQPKISSWGALSHLGPAPSEEEIDEIRREMCAGFGEGEI